MRRWLVAIASGVLGLLLLGWGLLFLLYGSVDLLALVVGISMIAAAVWLLRRPFATTVGSDASTPARPVRTP